MSKWYEVEIQQLIVVAVEVKDDESEDDAIEYARGECSLDGSVTIECALVEGSRVDSVKRHADKVTMLEDL